jgi:hypothetical protein
VERQWLSGRLTQHIGHPTGQGNEDQTYRQGREYTYIYNGQLMTGIPNSSKDRSGTRVQAVVSLVFETEQRAFLQLSHIRFGSINEPVVNPRQIQPFEMFEPVEIDEQLKQKLRLSVRFEYINGMIKDIHLDSNEQPWSANIKRSVLNMLQINLNKERRTDSVVGGVLHSKERDSSVERSERLRDQDFFTVIEDTIEGECETAYTILSVPSEDSSSEESGSQENSGKKSGSKSGSKSVNDNDSNVLNVTKSINFEKCQRRPDIRYNYRFQDWCPSCEQRYSAQERHFLSSTLIKQNVTVNNERDKVLIESAIVESQYTYMPYNEQGNFIQTHVNQTLVLISSTPIKNREITQLSSPMKSDSQLIWTPDWDISKERFFMEGGSDFNEKSPYSEIKNKVQFIKHILAKLINYIRTSVDEEAPRQYARLVKVMRMLKREEIEEVHTKFFKDAEVEGFTREELHKIRSILPDVIAQVGTKQAIDHLVEKIQSGDIKPWRGAVAIRKLQSVRTVSEPMLHKLKTLTTEEWCGQKSKSMSICESSYLAIGSMLSAMCAPNKDKLALEFKKSTEAKLCPREVKQKWVDTLFTQFEKCESEMCRVNLLKTLSNAALDLSAVRLEKIARDKDNKYSQLVQVEAILAYKNLINQMPRKVQNILMPIYMNKLESPYVRMAAFHKLMQTQPEKFILDQLTRSLFEERNRQVASFAYTQMQTLANSTNPCEKRFAHDLTLSLRHARHMPYASWWSYSKFMRASTYSTDQNRGIYFDFNSIYSNYSLMPKDMSVSMHMNMGNMYMRNVLTLGASQSNFDYHLRRLIRSQSHNLQTSLSDLLEGKLHEQASNPRFRKSLESIYDQLKLRQRGQSSSQESSEEEQTEQEDDAFAMLYMRVFGQEYGFLPLSQDIIPEQFVRAFEKDTLSLSKLIKDAERLLKNVEIPFSSQSATFLHEMSRKIPTTFGMPLQLSSKSPAVAQATGIFRIQVDGINKIRVELKQFKPSFTVTAVSKVEVWSPIVNTGIKIVAQAKLYAPSSVRLSIDAEKVQPEVKITIEPTEGLKEFDLIKLSTRPIATVLVWPRFMQQWQEPQEKTIHSEEWTRVNTINKVYGEQSLGIALQVNSQWHHTPSNRISSTPFCPYSGPNKFVVRVRPGLEMPKEYELTLSGKLFEQLSGASVSPKFEKFFEKSDEFSGEDDSGENNKNSMEDERLSKHYRTYKESTPTQHQIKFVATTRGSSIKRELVAQIDYQIGQEGKVQKVVLKIERTPVPTKEQDAWKMQAELETLLPTTPMTVSEVTSDKKLMTRFNVKWGHISAMDKYIDIKMVGDQSSVMRKLVEKSLFKKTFEQEPLRSRHQSLFSPVGQYEHTVAASFLDQYKLDIDYQVSPAFKNVTEKVFRMYKYWNYWQTDIDSQLPVELQKKDQIRIKFNIDPVNNHYFNVTVQTPKEITRMEDMPIYSSFKGINIRKVSSPKRSFYQWIVSSVSSDYENAVCQVRTDRINTFDNVDYRSPISTCYSVLAKDCGQSKESNKFVVMIKRQSDESEMKTIKIVSEDVKLVIRARQSSSSIDLECELNGASPVPCAQLEHREHQHSVLRVEKLSDEKYVRVILPEAGVRVFFDGLSANIKVSPVYTRSVCGMCGDYNQEESFRNNCELRTAQKECVSARIPRELKKLFVSYLVRTGSQDNLCTKNIDRYTNDNEHYEWKPTQWERSNEELYSSLEESTKTVHRSNERTVVQPILRTLTIEQAHEICFSKVPVAKCPRHTVPTSYKKGDQKIVYSCLERSNPQAEEFLRLLGQDRTKVINEVRELAPSFSQSERVPLKCETIDF